MRFIFFDCFQGKPVKYVCSSIFGHIKKLTTSYSCVNVTLRHFSNVANERRCEERKQGSESERVSEEVGGDVSGHQLHLLPALQHVKGVNGDLLRTH